MGQHVNVKILDDDEPIDDQNIPRLVNLAHQGYADAAYWRGRCDGMEISLAYLNSRLDLIQGLFVEAIEEGKEAGS